MEFIKDIHEARMTRDSNNARKLTYTDCCERAYLILLCVEAMRHHMPFATFARKYAKKTCEKNNYNTYSMFSTDLYNFLYFIQGDEDAMQKLKDPEAAIKTRKSITLPSMAVNRYLAQLGNDARPTDVPSLFMKVEAALKITNGDYQSIRRAVANIAKLSRTEKEKTLTRLAFAVRAKLRDSDVIEEFEKFITVKDYEVDTVKDPEPTVSVPDLPGATSGLQYYRYLVGQENIMMAKKFLDTAKNGGTVPAQYVQGYLPIVKMIDDIVQAGPAYIQNLRVIHQRAKKNLK